MLTVRFKMHHGSKSLDAALAVQFVVALIDGVGSTIKLSANVRPCCFRCSLSVAKDDMLTLLHLFRPAGEANRGEAPLEDEAGGGGRSFRVAAGGPFDALPVGHGRV